MNILGKICVCLIPLLSAFGLYEAGQLAKKRNAITETIVAEKKKRDANIEEIAKTKNTRLLEVEALNRLMESWGRQWTAKGQVDAQTAQLLLNIGTAQGLAAQELAAKRPAPSVYVFNVQPDGSSKFVGEFVVANVEPQRTLLKLARRPYPGEVQQWPAAESDYRIRERIPPGQRAIFHDLVTNQAIADQQVVNEEAKLKIQDNHIASSQQTLERRLAELNGDPAAPPMAAPEMVNGLVQTLRTEEAERNKVLKDVDELRRRLSETYARLQDVLAENRSSVEALTPAGAETAGRSADRAN